MSTLSNSQLREVSASARCIYSESQVEAALDEMAAAITRNLEDSNPISLSVMNGALIVTAKLATRLHFPLQLDYLHVTRYRGNTCGGDLDWKCYPSLSLQDRAVLVVDDILDEGATLECVVSYCKQGGASEVLTAVLVEKLHEHKLSSIEADFVGLQVDDYYIYGYGMDYKGYFRNLPGIYAIAKA